MATKEMTKQLPDGMIFQEPPKAERGRKPVWPTRLAPVAENRGQWVRVCVYDSAKGASGAASNLSRGKLKTPETEGQWEFQSGRIDSTSDQYGLWVRLI